MKLLECLQLLVVAPFGLAFFSVFLVFWLLWTLTGIGPLLQCYWKSLDNRKLSSTAINNLGPDLGFIVIPGDIHSCSLGKSYRVFVSFSKPTTPSAFPPICIPNGLGANAVLIRKMQEYLVDAGFAVLSFDRLGVGLSDENVSGSAPTALDVVAEMETVMASVLPVDTKWILLGPSMGSIVAQCYIAQYPHKVVGFLNMDGLPYPFIQQKNAFAWAGFIYRIYASIVWTGILRPFLSMAGKDLQRMFGSRTFGTDVILALMNQRKFFQNVALEMATMMDCCAMTEREWGAQSLLRLSPSDLETLVRAAPDESVTFAAPLAGSSHSGQRNTTLDRSPSEVGAQWSTVDEVQHTLTALLHGSAKPAAEPSTALLGGQAGNSGESGLLRAWRGLVVRVMSARNHDFGNAVANSFYTQEMRNTAAAEHAVHTLCARNGRRTVYPHISHTAMFTHTEEIVNNMLEIAEALRLTAAQ